MSELRKEITCINCWGRFAPEDVLWIAEHQELVGDPVVPGDGERVRFLPSRFNLRGNALDLYGMECRDLACPKCHLTIPRTLLEREPVFISLLGTPTCGKSFYLGALAATARRELPAEWHIDFTDADPTANMPIIAYEEALFHQLEPEKQVQVSLLIRKTQLGGDLYREVLMQGQSVRLPKPFSFFLKPGPLHRNYEHSEAAQLVCLYDNAGEHFLPGEDSGSSPGTRHMAEAGFLLYLFDPTQDPRWLSAVRKEHPHLEIRSTQQLKRQEDVLREAAARVRALRGMREGEKHDRPLFVILNKHDCWDTVVPRHKRRSPALANQMPSVNLEEVKDYSGKLRAHLLRTIPELVTAAENFCSRVIYVAATTLGTAPEHREGTPYIRPCDIRPDGVLLPFLLGLQLTTRGLLEYDDEGHAGNASARRVAGGSTYAPGT